MENHNSLVSPKFFKTSSSSSSSSWSSAGMGLVRSSPTQQPFRLHSGSTGTQKDRVIEKSKASPKTPAKEQTKPLEMKLHTQLRSIKRAGFNYLVAIKMNLIEKQRQEEEKIQKILEEEDIRRLRKEMIPRAQLMPVFDRPFFPQRSTRPLTIPKEPSFHSFTNKICRGNSSNEPYYHFHHFNSQSRKPIK